MEKVFMALVLCALLIISPQVLSSPLKLRWKPKNGPLNGTSDDTCEWHNVNKDDFPENKAPFAMCLNKGDIISDIIRKKRRDYWPDCRLLLSLWHEIYVKDETSTVIDAGANIGSCSLLLAANNVHVLSFEPLPSNLFHFTNSVVRNGPPISENIHLFPIGLGDAEASHTMFTQKGNRGNSVVDVAVADKGNDEADMKRNSFTIHVHQLDNVLWPNSTDPAPHYLLMKVDVQGYEVKLLHGAQRLLKAQAIKVLKLEVAPRWLQAQGTTPKAMCDYLVSFGYMLAHMERGKIDAAWCEDFFVKYPTANEVDILAYVPSMDNIIRKGQKQ